MAYFTNYSPLGTTISTEEDGYVRITVADDGWLANALNQVSEVFTPNQLSVADTSSALLNSTKSWLNTNWKWLLIGGVAGLVIFKRK